MSNHHNQFISQTPRLILASSSPRRAAILKQYGIQFEVFVFPIDESRKPREDPKQYALRLALTKAQRACQKLKPSSPTYFLSADTVVCLSNEIFGKPQNKEEAIQILQTLSGKAHQVITAYALMDHEKKVIIHDYCQSQVIMKPLTLLEIKKYVETKEPFDKAGAYAAQGLGAKMIEQIDGLVSNVIGLPIEEILPWLKRRGIAPPSFS